MTIQCEICWEQLEHSPGPSKKDPPRGAIKKKGKKLSSSAKTVQTEDVVGVVATPCGHLYHKKCIVDWLGQQTARKEVRNCPACRARILKNAKLLEVFPSTSEELERQISTLEKEKAELIGQISDSEAKLKELQIQKQDLLQELELKSQQKAKCGPETKSSGASMLKKKPAPKCNKIEVEAEEKRGATKRKAEDEKTKPKNAKPNEAKEKRSDSNSTSAPATTRTRMLITPPKKYWSFWS
jgi:flagellar biosynthesis/type III secretory pathway chaperone